MVYIRGSLWPSLRHGQDVCRPLSSTSIGSAASSMDYYRKSHRCVRLGFLSLSLLPLQAGAT